MEEFTICCTEEQIKKALNLGAPLNSCYHNDDFQNTIKIGSLHYVEIPTAEQMIGWLEDEIKGSVSIDKSWCSGHRKWIWTIVDDFETVIDSSITFYQSRKEATLAAIDAALEYLSKNK